MGWYQYYYKNATKYFSKHPIYNSTVHALGGIAIGLMIARPFDGGHPLKLALIFATLAVLGHLIPVVFKMK